MSESTAGNREIAAGGTDRPSFGGRAIRQGYSNV